MDRTEVEMKLELRGCHPQTIINVKKQAALNYIQSLQLNPQNENALKMLKQLVE